MRQLLLNLILFCLLLAAPFSIIAAEPITKQQAANIANSKFQGRVLAVDEGQQNNTAVYRVKVLDKEGGVHTVIIDHQTGNIISAH